MGRKKRRWRKKKDNSCRQYYGNMYPGHLVACADWTE